MRAIKYFFVYIATNYPRCSVLYTGVTNNIVERESQHKLKINKQSFSAKYNINRVVYYEIYEDSFGAIAREKQIKSGSRQKKIDLVNSVNSEWEDLVDWV